MVIQEYKKDVKNYELLQTMRWVRPESYVRIRN